MADPTSLEVFRGSKKEPCFYCGGPPHKVPLACPRICEVWIDPELGVVTGITFKDGFEFPPDAA